MGKALRASVLVLLLACSAHAGWIQNDSPAPPPPPSQPANVVQEPTNAADEPTTNGVMPNDAADSLTQIALELLAVLPALF